MHINKKGKKMIIDIVLGQAQGRGGLEDVLTTVSNELEKRGNIVRVFQAYEPSYKEWVKTMPRMYFYGINGGFNKETIGSLIKGYSEKIMELGAPDIVLATHTPLFSYICRKSFEALGKSRPNIISWIHGSPSYYGKEELLNYADAHITISSKIAEEIEQIIKKKNPVYHVGNPVYINNFHKLEKIDDKMELIYVGRLDNHQKRLDIMFKGLSLLKFNWKLKIIGTGEDEIKLKELAKDLRINENINWLGWKEEPWKHVKGATALVLTSNEEGFGLVMIEALGRGIPVISSDNDGANDIIKHGHNGWIFKKEKFEELSMLINEIRNKKLSVTQENCIKSVEKFSTENVIDKIEYILKNYDKNGEYIKSLNEYKSNIKVLIENEHIDEAKNLINEYINLIGEDSEICCMRAVISTIEGKIESAYNILRNGMDLYREDLDLIFNLAYVSYLLEKNDEAIKYYNYILGISEDELLHKEIKTNLDEVYKKIEKNNENKLVIDIVILSISGRGGTEKAISTVSKELIKRGHRVRVFQAYKSSYDEWERDLDEIYYYGVNSSLEKDNLESLAMGYRKKITELGKPNAIIAAHQPIMSGICKLAVLEEINNPPKIVSWLHSNPKHMGNTELLKYSDVHMSISKSISKEIFNITGSTDVYLVGNPVDDKNITMINRNLEILELVYVGRLENSFKRIDILLKSLSLLKINWKLTIIGSGEHEDELMELSKKLNIYDNIEWLGWKENPWDFIKSATALVLPSDSEAFGLVLVEALQRGLPVIVSDCEGPKDIVENFKNGFVFEKGNYEQLSSILNKVYKRELKLPNQQECIESVNSYNIENVVNKIEITLLKQVNDK